MHMKLENRALDDLFSNAHTALIVSDAVSGIVLEHNDEARALLGAAPDNILVVDFFGLSKDDRSWYDALEISPYAFDCRAVQLGRIGREQVLDSLFCESDHGTVRIDTLCDIGCTDRTLCYYKYELVSRHQTWKYPDRGVKNSTIYHLLEAALFIYGADRCFIFEIDPDIKCVVDLFSKNRSGFHDSVSTERLTDEAGIAGALEAWQDGKTISWHGYTKNDQSEQLRTQLYSSLDVWDTITIPFPAKSGIRCFLSIDNYRRFGNCESVLRNIAILAAGEMQTERLSGTAAYARQLSSTLSHTPENQIIIHMFGGLTVSTSMGIQQDESFYSTQCGTFFVYLLSNRRRIVPVQELAEILWPDQIIDNPYNMIKSVAFRTKRMFDSICSLPLIVAGGGTYAINKKLNIWVDTEEFELLCQKAFNTQLDAEKRLAACSEAVALYKGSALPNFDAEIWLSAKINYYRVLYNDLILVYIQLLREKKDIRDLIRVVAQAAAIEELDSGIHLFFLETLIDQKYDRYAKSHFHKVKSHLLPEEQQQFWDCWNAHH